MFDTGTVAPDALWITRNEFGEGVTVWSGREGFIEFMRTWTEVFEGWSIQPERLIDAGDGQVVVFNHQSATGIESGVPVEVNMGQVWEVKDGCVVRVTNYFTGDDALEAAGLRE